jgi:sterol 3beta-glucosyltransferase
MRIAIIAPGSRGDVQPYIALGIGLQNAGHTLRFVSHQNFEALVTSHGLDFWSDENDVQEIVQNEEMRKRVEGGNFLSLMALMAKEAKIRARTLAEVGLDACRGMDLLLAGMGGIYTGLSLAERLKLPLLQAYLVPFTPTGSFASVLLAGQPAWFGAPLNRFSHHVTRQIIWQGIRSADNLSRQQVLKIPSASFWGPYHSKYLQGLPILYGFSPALIPAPPDWDQQDTHITGYWFLDSTSDWTPPADLVDFLASGSPPVYIGFGSMSNRDPQETANLVIEALAKTGKRAIMLSGWGGLHTTDLPETIFMVDSVPHAWLFPRLAAIVHHGGAGTTAAALRAGVPSVVIPFFGDQPFWGRIVAERGLGPGPIPRKKLTAERLASAIHTAVTDKDMRQRAARIGEVIRAEDGVGGAVEIIHGLEKR